jgi:hypothetical protein
MWPYKLWLHVPTGTFHLVNVVRADDLATSSLKHLEYQLHVLFWVFKYPTSPLTIMHVQCRRSWPLFFSSTHVQQSSNNRRRNIQFSQLFIVLILFIKDCTFLCDNVKQVKLAKTSTLWVRFNSIREIECPIFIAAY